jgi:hypothetical protein
MLSDRERRELARIEQALAADDRRLAQAFGGRSVAARPRRRWPVRALIGFGVLLLVVGLLTGADGLFVQGLLFGGAGVLWARWRARHPAAGPSDDGGGQPASSPHPDGSPPGWFRPV